MSKSNKSEFEPKSSALPVKSHRFGNKYASIPYDQKRIRDELKSNFYKAANFLNFTQTQAKDFVAEIKSAQELGIESKITVFEALIVDAIGSRRWDLIDRILDRIIPKIQNNDSNVVTILDELTQEQKQRALAVAQKTAVNE